MTVPAGGMTAPRVVATDGGVLVLVPVSDARGAPDDVHAAVAALAPDERAMCAPWALRRQATFAAGRSALRAALREAGVALAPHVAIGKDDRGAPVVPGLPAGVAVSITHKDTLAGALVAPVSGGARVGVDLELDEPRDRAQVESLIAHTLTDDERAALPDAHKDGDDARRAAWLARFSAKEALYKAIDPFVRRYVGFLEVRCAVAADGAVSFVVPDRGLVAEGRVLAPIIPGVVVTTARAAKGKGALMRAAPEPHTQLRGWK